MRLFCPTSHQNDPRRQGFTLIEAALTTIIVGVGFLAMMQLFGACTTGNAYGNAVTTASMLGNNVRETMQGLAFNDPIAGSTNFGMEAGETLANFNDLDDFDGQVFNPPIDATRSALANFSRYSQVVTVMPVDENQPSINWNETAPAIPKTAYTGALRIRVRVMYAPTDGGSAKEVYRAQWVRMDR